MINQNDLQFLLKKTGLDLKRFITLIEEDRDFDLVIESIACHLDDQDREFLSKLSEKLRTKIVLYSLSCHKNYDISEKSYITDILSKNYNYIYKNGYVLGKGHKREIRQLLCVIKENKSDNNTIKYMAANFNKLGRKDIATHVPEWLKIISKSKEILSVNTCN